MVLREISENRRFFLRRFYHLLRARLRGITMPTKRRRGYKRRSSPLYKGPKFNASVRKVVNRSREKHRHESAYGATGILLGGAGPNSLTSIGQGTGYSNRIGDEIEAYKLTIRGTVVAGDATNLMRIIVFKFNGDSGVAAPVVTDVVPGFAGAAGDMWRPQNFSADKDQTILYDRVLSTSTQRHFTISLYGKRLGSKKVRFNPGATTGFGKYYICFWSDSAGVPNPTMEYRSVFEFTDA